MSTREDLRGRSKGSAPNKVLSIEGVQWSFPSQTVCPPSMNWSLKNWSCLGVWHEASHVHSPQNMCCFTTSWKTTSSVWVSDPHHD